MRSTLVLLALLTAGLLSLTFGCASYSVPGGPADFRALGITADEQAARTDETIAARLARKPAASFPAGIASVRLQDEHYSSYSYGGSEGNGRYSVITLRDVETSEQFERLGKLPMVRGVAPMNRLVVRDRINDEKSLRAAAADLQADVLFVYTFDTRFGTKTLIPVLGTITLGIFPAEEARVTCTASGALIDTRTGYIYGLAEATAKTDQLANMWTSREAVEESRLRAERDAFEQLVVQVEKTWTQVAATYGPAGVAVVPVAETTPRP